MPCWLQVTALAAAYYKEIAGIPTVQEVHEGDLTIARWNYWPAVGGVYYQGIWDNGLDSGEWGYIQAASPTKEFRSAFKLSIALDPGFAVVEVTNEPGGGGVGQWYVTTPSNRDMTSYNAIEFPWLAMPHKELDVMRYWEIRANGQDSDDTSPITWDGP
jgi:hypothetical protein